jgi:hypothetical protein
MKGHVMKLEDVDGVLKDARAGDESCGRYEIEPASVDAGVILPRNAD